MDNKKIIAGAKKLHKDWLKQNRDFVDLCLKDPNQTKYCHDFSRAVPWKDLPVFWKNHYKKEARIELLTRY